MSAPSSRLERAWAKPPRAEHTLSMKIKRMLRAKLTVSHQPHLRSADARRALRRRQDDDRETSTLKMAVHSCPRSQRTLPLLAPCTGHIGLLLALRRALGLREAGVGALHGVSPHGVSAASVLAAVVGRRRGLAGGDLDLHRLGVCSSRLECRRRFAQLVPLAPPAEIQGVAQSAAASVAPRAPRPVAPARFQALRDAPRPQDRLVHRVGAERTATQQAKDHSQVDAKMVLDRAANPPASPAVVVGGRNAWRRRRRRRS